LKPVAYVILALLVAGFILAHLLIGPGLGPH
jgi:hypothetical protein